MELSNILRSYKMLQIASISNLNEDNSHICAKISINIVNVLMSGVFFAFRIWRYSLEVSTIKFFLPAISFHNASVLWNSIIFV